MKLQGKTLLVTGATGGIGVELCKLLAGLGVRLLLNGSRANELERQQVALGDSHRYVCADLSTEKGRELILQACTEIGGVDGIVNLAGTLHFELFERQTTSQIQHTIATNMLAPILLCHGLLPMLRTRPEAIIFNVGSIFASIGHPGFVTYCATKAGIKSFTEALSRELADSAIEVAYLAPRATNTAMNDARVNGLNRALGNTADSPQLVARELVNQISSGQKTRYLGWPEKLYVRINALFPGLVSQSFLKNLKVIKEFALQESIS